MAAIVKDRNITFEERESSCSLQSSMFRAPLMPVWIPSHVESESLRPTGMTLQPVNVKANKHLNKTPTLRNVMFELTLACNLNCIHCYCNAGKPRSDELEVSEIMHFIDYLANAEVDSITFTGGEPLLHKDFLTIARHASDQGFGITVFTNGELLDDTVLEAFLEMKIESIQISLDGAKPETHDFIRSKKGLFEKAVRAIKESKQRGFPVIIMSTLVEQNQDEMFEICRLCEKLEVEGWCMNLFIPVGRAKKLNPVSFQKLSQIRKQIGVSPAICNNTACGVGFEKIAVLSNGNICPCEVVQSNVMGNIRENSLLDIFYYHPLMNKYRKSTVENIYECSACPVNLLCRGGCKSSALVRNGSIFSPDPTACHSWYNV